jgi:AcrR family transcriptional regulator
MARPKSDDKRNAILAAATEVVAEQGLAAPTAKIAKIAGVAEGSLFTYFATKDELLNQLYLELKSDLREAMFSALPQVGAPRDKLRHAWQQYVHWGVTFPKKRLVLAQLGVSERISAQSKTEGNRPFAQINALLQDSIATGALRERPAAFAGALMGALAEATMDFMANDPPQAEDYASSGFEAFWNAITAS